MIRNYLLIALRNLWRNKLHAAINVTGLAIGISACLVIYLIVSFELSFDTFRTDADRIYRVYSRFTGVFEGTNPGVPAPAPAFIRDRIGGIEEVAALHTQNFEVEAGQPGGEQKDLGQQDDIVITGPEYFKVFPDYEWLSGTPETALTAPGQVVLTERKARLYFGVDNPVEAVGREIFYRDSLAVTVAGIIKDPPVRTDLYFQDFISLATMENTHWLAEWASLDNWTNTNSSSQVFLKLAPGTTATELADKLQLVVDRYNEDNDNPSWKAAFELQPLAELHFDSDLGIFNNGRSPAHRPTLYALILLAILLLVIAAINFINLETAQAVRRSKEVGIRKVLGSTRPQLITQFLGETTVLTLLAVVMSILISEWALRYFHDFVPEGVTLRLTDPAVAGFLLLTVLGVSVLAGAYPALVLSSFRPALALKDQFQSVGGRKWGIGLRRGLIVFQFIVAQALIFGTFTIGRQIHFMLHKDLGFDQDAIVYLTTPWTEPIAKVGVLYQQLRQLPEVTAISRHYRPPAENGYSTSIMKYKRDGETVDLNVHRKFGDTAYIGLYGLELLAGRNLHASDSIEEFVINEQLARQMGLEHPADAVGQQLEINDRWIPVVGVVKDFHLRSLHNAIEPAAIGDETSDFRTISVKLQTQGREAEGFSAMVKKMEVLWKKIYPDQEFSYQFFDEALARMYEGEQRTAKLARTATFVAILISCLGLLGLISFAATQRTKEIGIRKVLGATVFGLIALLSKDFLRLVLLAGLFAFPVAWYGMNRWLADYAYHIEISWWMVALASLGALAITLLTVGLRAWRAARANPVESLKYE